MDQRNLLVAIVLSVGILIGFQFLAVKLHLVTPSAPTLPTATKTGPATPKGEANAPGAAAPGVAAPGAGGESAGLTREAAIGAQKRVPIDTPRLNGSIALSGARIDDLSLATYHETTDPGSPDVVLLVPGGTPDAYFAQFGWASDPAGAKVPGPETPWSQSGSGKLTPKTPLTLTWDNGAGLLFTRKISVDENYMFTIDDTVKNTGSTSVTLRPYGLISRTGTPPASGFAVLHEGLIGYIGGEVLGGGFVDQDTYAKLEPGKPREYDSTGGWLGFTDKYWLTALVPPQDAKIRAEFRHTIDADKVDRYQADYTGAPVAVSEGGSAATATRFFAGAKEVDLLNAYRDAGIPKFDLAIDWGHFFFLTKPIFAVLQFFAGVLGNFGLAILLLTFLIKLAFFPLANKSYSAMSKMKLLQPEMQKIRERFPDDKPRQQQEIMAMYKKVGANPLAGCLPIVIQIPVFFSLYKVLFVTIEMRHAPFFGWIHDLSAPDPTSFANLFGLLPYAPPHFLMIGAWPLIMGVTMFLQQKLNPQPVDPVQARMFMALPVVFTYMLSAFPAGLVIYWAWNNLLSIAQQWMIMHRAGAA